MQLFLSFIIALLVTTILMPPLMRWAEPLRFVDITNARKVHSGSIPRVGGIAMVAGTVLAMIAWRGQAQEITAVLLAILVILAFGVLDDRFSLDFRIKFVGQLIAALLVVFGGDVIIERLLFWDAEPMPRAIAISFTMFALLGIINAVNLSDGLDGLAGGTTILSLAAMAVLAYMAGGYGVATLAFATMGSILGFLRFNTHPARAFMGDTGSQFLGFTAGVISIVLTQKVHPALSYVLPLYLLGLPILDTFMVMARRIREGRSPFSPDKNHIHHRLLALGFDHYEAVLIIYAVQAGLVATGYFLCYSSDAVLLAAYFGFCAAVVAGFHWAEHTGWRFQGRAVGEVGTLIHGRVRWLRDKGRVTQWAFAYVLGSIVVYLLAAALWGEGFSHDIAAAAVVFFVVLLAMYVARRGESFNMAERAGLYIVCAFAVHLIQGAIVTLPWLKLFDGLFFCLLAGAVVAAVLDCWKDRFNLTPSDFLVLFMALMVPFIPAEYFHSADQRFGLIKLIVLFYGVELLLYHFGQRADAMRLVGMAGFAAIGIRAFV